MRRDIIDNPQIDTQSFPFMDGLREGRNKNYSWLRARHNIWRSCQRQNIAGAYEYYSYVNKRAGFVKGYLEKLD